MTHSDLFVKIRYEPATIEQFVKVRLLFLAIFYEIASDCAKLTLDDSEEHDRLLEAMKATLTSMSEPRLKSELDFWLTGRDFVVQGNDDEAVRAFNLAIDRNDNDLGNPAVYFDRALSNMRLEEYEKALSDLEDVLVISAGLDLPDIWPSRVTTKINNHHQLYTAAWEQQTEYENIAQILLPPTSTPTPTTTKELTATFIPQTATPTLTATSIPPTTTPTAVFITPMPNPTVTSIPTASNTPYPNSQSDTDGDKLSDWDEILVYGTDPQKWDTDGDGLGDGDEVFVHGTEPSKYDTDGDQLSDREEVYLGTNPKKLDTDEDRLNDGAEFYTHHTDPLDWDTDGDGLSDGDEVLEYGTDPSKYDTDDDDLSDWDELLWYETNPTSPDTDGDGQGDGLEIREGTDPLIPNSESESLPESTTPTAETVTETVTPTQTALATATPTRAMTPNSAP